MAETKYEADYERIKELLGDRDPIADIASLSRQLHRKSDEIEVLRSAAARPEPPVEGALEERLREMRHNMLGAIALGVPIEDVARGLDTLIAAARSGHDGLLRGVLDEVERSRERFGEWSSSGSALTDGQRFYILSEEVGEVAEALVLGIDGGRFAKGREGHSDNLDAELVQVAAVAIGWLQARALSPDPVA